MPRAVSVKYGFSMSGITSAIAFALPVRRFRAVLLGTNFSSRAARCTASVFAGDTPTPLYTRDTVAGETPARLATS